MNSAENDAILKNQYLFHNWGLEMNMYFWSTSCLPPKIYFFLQFYKSSTRVQLNGYQINQRPYYYLHNSYLFVYLFILITPKSLKILSITMLPLYNSIGVPMYKYVYLYFIFITDFNRYTYIDDRCYLLYL